MTAPVQPQDRHNRLLMDRVRPADWKNPRPARRYNLVVLGGGTAGLVAAIGAAGLGARVALVEQRLLGGDCLVTGCVPSKALLASARAAQEVRRAGRHGIDADLRNIDFGVAMERMRRLRADLAFHDSALRLQEAGVDVFLGQGRFTAKDSIDVDGTTLRFSRACIATGARPLRPPIPGIDDAPVLTHERFFELTDRPDRLLVVGAGPIGCELAQAMRRLGSEVVVVEQAARLLPEEEPEASEVLSAAFAEEGIRTLTGARVIRFEEAESGWSAVLDTDQAIPFDRCLLAVGRAVRTDTLGLDAAGVEATDQGITVDAQLATTNPHIYAAGDCASRFRYTHAADALARIVVQNALFFGRRDHTALTIPWATYTDPEVAHVGLTWREAADRDDVLDLSRALSTSDRAICEGRTEGYVRAFCKKDGTILGATVVGEHAGDLIATMALAMSNGLGMKALSSAVFPYPTRAFELHRLGDDWSRTRLGGRVGRVLDTFLRWRR